MLVRCSLFIILCLISCLVSSGKPHAVSLSWIVDESDLVMVGSVMAAEVRGDDHDACGPIKYSIVAERGIVGPEENIEFCSHQELVIRGRYLAFFNTDSKHSNELALLGALPLTRSFLDADIDWVEVNTISGVDPSPLHVSVEEISRCAEEDDFPEDSDSLTDCRTIQARELVPFWMILQRVHERHNSNHGQPKY